MTVSRFLLTLIIASTPATAWSDSVTIGASRDNSVFQNNTGNRAGGLFAMFTGNNMMSSPRHALIAFDIAGNIPAGSEITGVELTLHLANAPAAAPQTVNLHRLTRDWVEGTAGSSSTTFSMIGNGFPSNASNGNGATWSHSHFSTTMWTTPGGDFITGTSGSASVGNTIDVSYTWASTQGMIDDVQSWLDSPSTNYGWLLRNAAAGNTIRAFYTRSAGVGNSFDPEFQPALTITYVPEPTTALLILMAVPYVICRRRRSTGR